MLNHFVRLSFPDIVDEVAVRLVAAQVLVISSLAALTGWWPLFGLLLVDFTLRVAFGPRSPLAQVALRLLRPRIAAAPRPTAGPPKRFAAGIGLVCSALVVAFGLLSWTMATQAVVAAMIVFPLLESVFAICAGCLLFSGLIRIGLVPERVCVECADITRRLSPAG
jgi:Domain of unknown function (DUF4395)